jgi:hypothetical protein
MCRSTEENRHFSRDGTQLAKRLANFVACSSPQRYRQAFEHRCGVVQGVSLLVRKRDR